MSQQHLLLDFCPQPLQNRAMGRPIIQVESHNMRTDRTSIFNLNAVNMIERFTILSLSLKQIMRHMVNVLMGPKCSVWFLAWYFFKPESKPDRTPNQNQYLTHG